MAKEGSRDRAELVVVGYCIAKEVEEFRMEDLDDGHHSDSPEEGHRRLAGYYKTEECQIGRVVRNLVFTK